MQPIKKQQFIPLITWLCITTFYCYQTILRSLPNIIYQELITKFGISASQFGSFAGIYYIGYIIAHVPIGIAISKIGPRIIIPLCISLNAMGLSPLIYPMFGWQGALVGRLLIGIGSSAAAVGALQLFRSLYPKRFATMLGLTAFLSLVIAVYIGNILGPMIIGMGFDKTLQILLYNGCLLAGITYYMMPKLPVKASSSSLIWTDLKSLMRNYKIIIIGLCAGLMVGTMEGFADAWGTAFLMQVYQLEKTTANMLILTIFLGMAIGCLLLPYIADKTNYYFGVTIVAGILLVTCFVFLLTGMLNKTGLSLACITIGICSAYQVIMLAKATTFVSEEQSGMVGAVVNMMIMAFGWIFHRIIGMTLEANWDGTIIDHVKKYNSASFIKAVAVIPVGATIAIMGLIILLATKSFKEKNTNL